MLVFIGCVLIFVLYLWHLSKFFDRLGVKMAPSYLSLIGDGSTVILLRKHFKDVVRNIYNSHPDEKYVGVFNLLRPCIVLTHPDVVNEVAVKNFNHFADRITSVEESADLFFGNSLFGLRGQKWKDTRSMMTSAFTGVKMRNMFDCILECAVQMTEFLEKQTLLPENNGVEFIQIVTKDTFTRYTHDAVTFCAVGLKLNSLRDANNKFFVNGSEFGDLTGFRFLKFVIMANFPKISKIFGINVASKKFAFFYETLVADTMKEREDSNLTRNDLMDLFVEVKKGNLENKQQKDENVKTGTIQESGSVKSPAKRVWTIKDFTALTLAFITTTLETTSNLMRYIVQELSLNPEILMRLQNEIDENNLNEGGKLTYDSLLKMKYLDMVVSETLRMWPTSVMVDRVCTKPYALSSPNSKSSKKVQLNVGDGVWIPIHALHYDPRYYKNPEIFDPERFSEENKHNIVRGTYLPFGVGPRNCIGSRLALLIVKTGIYSLLLNFDLISTEKARSPIKLQAASFRFTPQQEFTHRLKLRNKNNTTSRNKI